jgi:hypothetical protein
MTTTAFSTEVGAFSELRDDFVRLTNEIVWCTVATVDEKDRPRTRMLHVSWEVDNGRPTGWATTSRTPTKTAHLAHNPYVSCSYWTPAQNVVYVDCETAWVDDVEAKQHVWGVAAAEAARLGFDAYSVWPGGPTDPGFEVLRLDPWRVQITLHDMPNGKTVGSSRVWHAPGTKASR